MASQEYAKMPAPYSRQLKAVIDQSPIVEKADSVAAVAHAAIGQRRADRVTPYIDHPRRAATLVIEWNEAGVVELESDAIERSAAGALLHDVLEDTKLPREELSRQFPDQRKLLALVDRLTEPPGDPDAPVYYARIARDREAVIVKCADRCANLEDVLRDVRSGSSLDRWRRYLLKTKRDVLPILRDPRLEAQLLQRIEQIEHELV